MSDRHSHGRATLFFITPQTQCFMKKVLLCISVFAILGCSGGDGEKKSYKFTTGPQGGAWYPLGGAIKSLVESANPNLSIRVIPGGGVGNVKALHSGQASIALAGNISTMDGILGRDPFKEKMQGICNIATLYQQYFQVITLSESNITAANDIKGKVLATQPKGTTGEAVTNHLLLAHGMDFDSPSSVNIGSYTDSVTLMKDGNADVFTLATTIPSGAVMDLASARNIRVMPISNEGLGEMKKLNPGYEKGFIPKGTYPGQDTDVPTVIYLTHLAARCDVDDVVVTQLLESISNGNQELISITSALKNLTLEKMAMDLGIPMHQAARRWFEEKGVL